jgi:hypothetical protein
MVCISLTKSTNARCVVPLFNKETGWVMSDEQHIQAVISTYFDALYHDGRWQIIAQALRDSRQHSPRRGPPAEGHADWET